MPEGLPGWSLGVTGRQQDHRGMEQLENLRAETR